MHLRRVLLLNSGPTERCSFELPFHPDERPKPLLIVGGNGAGKTNFLSVIADGLMELAATAYQDILPTLGAGHSYYRVSGGRTRRVGAVFDLAALHLRHEGTDVYFRNAAGEIPFDTLTQDLEPFGGLNSGNKDKEKLSRIANELALKIFREGVYTFFPSSRHELPFWLNDPLLESDPAAEFKGRFTTVLNKPLVLSQGVGPLKPWIIDLILDQAIDATMFVRPAAEALKETLPAQITQAITRSQSLASLNVLVATILTKPDARIVRGPLGSGQRRIQIYFGATPGLSSLDALSAGQSTLLSIFGNALRLGTTTQMVPTSDKATGIVLVDEIDAHLHADLQNGALPALIAVFPNVQFIVTCHSPLFPLGMEKRFGADGFQIVEMPSAQHISPERYNEFIRSFEMYQATKAFEEKLKEVGSGGKPMVVCEGETDPLYLTTAADLLGYRDLTEQVEFKRIGDLDPSGPQTSGSGQLKKAFDIYKATLPLLGRYVLFLFDQKSPKQVKAKPFTEGKLSARILPLVADHRFADDGPENLLPASIFEDKFYVASPTRLSGTTMVEKKELKKVEFAEHVCKVLRDPAHFEAFRPALDEIRATLLTSPGTAGDAGGLPPANQ